MELYSSRKEVISVNDEAGIDDNRASSDDSTAFSLLVSILNVVVNIDRSRIQ